ncbi:TPM domain-containing protein [Heyndrickxia sporothermodurans]|uniref:TPM domain-containing protein n=1 Tax=Heyndrickxia sporothermodurans TaxID=46224 RepID=UPI000ADCA01D|nr:TPM domain-containing protein [Heyndrickxia sporothermodurans]
MSKARKIGHFFMLLSIIFVLFLPRITAQAESLNQKQFVYDDAKLLTNEEKAELEALSSKLSKERNTAFLIITVNGTKGKNFVQYVEDFYDEKAPGYDKPHGNTAILFIDMKNRDVHIAGYKKAEDYLDNKRIDLVLYKITPDLSNGDYFHAFSKFITLSHEYMGYRPGISPDNLVFKWWFQLLIAIGVAGLIVGLMAYRSGGRVTVNSHTYLNSNQSRIINKYDRFVRQTVTKQKKPSNNNSSGGGGISRGGHSHSGGSRKF